MFSMDNVAQLCGEKCFYKHWVMLRLTIILLWSILLSFYLYYQISVTWECINTLVLILSFLHWFVSADICTNMLAVCMDYGVPWTNTHGDERFTKSGGCSSFRISLDSRIGTLSEYFGARIVEPSTSCVVVSLINKSLIIHVISTVYSLSLVELPYSYKQWCVSERE